ncbi:MAG: hypothetical protein ACXV3S_10285 [Kineosporiaceae bacterium]
MRQAFAHEARLDLTVGGDECAPGAAVTVALCGHWDHEPPCRVPHRSDIVARDGDHLTLRVLFACPPGDAGEVRRTVEAALDAGTLPVPGPNDVPPAGWRVVRQAAAPITEGEQAVAGRLVAHPEA